MHGILEDTQTGGLLRISRFDSGAALSRNIGAEQPKSMEEVREGEKKLNVYA
jgi:hypothetical protein